MNQIEAMKNPRDGLQIQHDLLVEKLARLRKAYALEAKPEVHLQLEEQIKQAEKERGDVNKQFTWWAKYSRSIAVVCGAVVLLTLMGVYLYYPPRPKPPEVQQINQDHAAGHIYTGTVYIRVYRKYANFAPRRQGAKIFPSRSKNISAC